MSLGLRLPQHEKDRNRQDLKLIGIKVRPQIQQSLKNPHAGNQPFGRNVNDLREQKKLLAADPWPSSEAETGAGEAHALGDRVLTETVFDARLLEAFAE